MGDITQLHDGNKRNLIIISNRLPLSIKKSPDGKYQSSLSSGGLVTSLSGLTKSSSFRWFGWPGINVEDEHDREEVRRSLGEQNAVPVFLDEGLANEHYNGFSSMLGLFFLSFLSPFFWLHINLIVFSNIKIFFFFRSDPLANPTLPNCDIQRKSLGSI